MALALKTVQEVVMRCDAMRCAALRCDAKPTYHMKVYATILSY